MNPPRVARAVTELREVLAEESGLSAILFGSAARGTASEDSDLDILILTERDPHPLLRRIREVERRHDLQISPLLLKPAEFADLDRQFVDSLLRDGEPLVGSLPPVTVAQLRLRPFRLVRLFVSHLEPRAKVRLSRLIDGYATTARRGRKHYAYRSRGLLERVGGWRVGRGAIVLPDTALAELERILEDLGARRHVTPIWIQAP